MSSVYITVGNLEKVPALEDSNSISRRVKVSIESAHVENGIRSINDLGLISRTYHTSTVHTLPNTFKFLNVGLNDYVVVTVYGDDGLENGRGQIPASSFLSSKSCSSDRLIQSFDVDIDSKHLRLDTRIRIGLTFEMDNKISSDSYVLKKKTEGIAHIAFTIGTAIAFFLYSTAILYISLAMSNYSFTPSHIVGTASEGSFLTAFGGKPVVGKLLFRPGMSLLEGDHVSTCLSIRTAKLRGLLWLQSLVGFEFLTFRPSQRECLDIYMHLSHSGVLGLYRGEGPIVDSHLDDGNAIWRVAESCDSNSLWSSKALCETFQIRIEDISAVAQDDKDDRPLDKVLSWLLNEFLAIANKLGRLSAARSTDRSKPIVYRSQVTKDGRIVIKKHSTVGYYPSYNELN